MKSRKAIVASVAAVLAAASISIVSVATNAGTTNTPGATTNTPGATGNTSSDAPVTSGDTSSDTSADTSSDASTDTSADKVVKPIEVEKVEAAVKVGETATVKAGDLGEVAVTVDKDDANLKDAKVAISATNTEATVKTNIEKAVGEKATAETKEKVEAAVAAVKNGDAFALDIGFTDKDGKSVQPGKAVSITVALPEALKDATKVYVYHVSDAGIEEVKSEVKDGKLTITNDKFSPYIVSKVEIKAKAADDKPDNKNTGVALAVAPIVLAGAAVAVAAVSKKKK